MKLVMPDEKQILLDYIEFVRYEAAQEAAQKAIKETDKEIVIKVLKAGKMTVEEIAQCVSSLSVEDVKKLQEELLLSVEEQKKSGRNKIGND